MSITLDECGNAVTEPFKSIREVISWTPSKFSRNSAQLHSREPPFESDSDAPSKFRAGPSRPQLLVCHDMCGGYLEDRFVHGCSKVSAYKLYHWQLIDIFVYFSHNFVTIPPIGWIKAAKKHGVTVLGTIITEWDKGAEICKELLKSEETIDQFTTKLAQLAFLFGFNGWLVNIENKVESNQVPQLQTFVHQLTVKCHHLLGVSKVLWYDSVINTGELKWQDELNSLNEMFFTVSDGIFLNYCITEEKLSRSRQMSSVCSRELDVFVGIDVFGRLTPGGGGFNTRETLKMILDHGLSCALFAPGWVYEHQGDVQFDSQEIVFWGLLSEMLTPRPIEVPFGTSFCRGYGERYYVKGQVLTDLPWYNLSLQQVQPSFTHSQFVSYTVTKVIDCEDLEKENQQDEEENQQDEEENQPGEQKQKFRFEVESCVNHPACPEMMFDLKVGYLGGGSLRLTAKRLESVPVLFRIFVLKAQSEKSLGISVSWNISSDSACLGGLVISAGGLCEPNRGATVICTETDLCDQHKEMIQKMLQESGGLSSREVSSASLHFVTGARADQIVSKDGKWITCFFYVDSRLLSREGSQSQEFILSVILIPSLELKDENQSNVQMCAYIGYLQVLGTTDLIPVQQDFCVRNFKCLEVKVNSLLSKEQVNQIAMHPCFDEPGINMSDSQYQLKEMADKKQLNVMSEAKEENDSSERRHESNNSNIPLVISRHTIELPSVTSADIQYKLYVLKWEAPKDNIDAYLMFNYDESGVKNFIGHAMDNWFVWKQASEEKKVTKFSLQPIMAHSAVLAAEVCFCV